jgi:hypothetical protein
METTRESICYYDQKLILIPKFIDIKKVYCPVFGDFNDQYVRLKIAIFHTKLSLHTNEIFTKLKLVHLYAKWRFSNGRSAYSACP